VKPVDSYNLDSLKTVLSTGSPLSVDNFEFIYRDIKSDVQLSSISGGTDINGCFALGDPTGPVYAGELQCRGLGMKVEAFDETGQSTVGQQGELVCTAATPSMPIYFWDDPDGNKYRSAYFDVYPGVWRHGDFVEITDRGSLIMHGRSDATLNPGGVRIGTAEIYRQVEQIDEVADSLIVGQDWKGDVRVILFVQMAEKQILTDEVRSKIVETIRINASPRHVPAKIIAVPDIPYTHNMKKVEIAVKNLLSGKPVLNKEALRNPEALDHFAAMSELVE
jgi:acetoacetyl-CoA synthetase